MGNSYSEIALKGVRDMKFDDINLSDNRLEGDEVEEMIHSINLGVKKIDMSKNRIGKHALSFMAHLTQRKSNLKILNLEKTCLGDATAIEIIKFAQKSITIESLNLSDNKLTDNITEPLIETLDGHDTLKEIYLRWNCLTDKFGKEFFGYFNQEEKVQRMNLKVLDLGWNRMGKALKVILPTKARRRGPPQPELSTSIAEFLENNKTIVHFDLCSNKFRYEECKEIAEGLKKNHTIYGFHFEGNYGYVDSEGFLVIKDAFKDFSSEHHTRQIDSVNRLDNFHKFYQQIEADDARNVCWICDGWIEMKFEYRKEISEDSTVFIHFKHEGYQPIYMRKQEGDEYPSVTIMVPNARLFYFFLVDFETEFIEEAPNVLLTESEEIVGFIHL